jgi:hypothetical protein
MAGMNGYNGQGTGMQGMTDGGMGGMNMGGYGAQGTMTGGMNNGMNGMNMGDMNGMNMGDMNGMNMGGMNGMNMGDMNGMNMGGMNGMNMGDMNGMNMGGMNGSQKEISREDVMDMMEKIDDQTKDMLMNMMGGQMPNIMTMNDQDFAMLTGALMSMKDQMGQGKEMSGINMPPIESLDDLKNIWEGLPAEAK